MYFDDFSCFFFQFIGEEDLFERRDDTSDLWNPKAKVVEYGHGGAGGQPAPPGSGPAESQDNRLVCPKLFFYKHLSLMVDK